MRYFLIFVALAASVSPVLAHHAFAAEFDNKKPIELTGTVVELEWVNPHTWIHMDVTDPNGKTTMWHCELGSPNVLLGNGWRKDSFRKGDVIVVSGSQAKDGSNLANARTVRSLDGRRIFNAGSSGDPRTPADSKE